MARLYARFAHGLLALTSVMLVASAVLAGWAEGGAIGIPGWRSFSAPIEHDSELLRDLIAFTNAAGFWSLSGSLCSMRRPFARASRLAGGYVDWLHRKLRVRF